MIRDFMLGWPPALDIIDAPTEHKPQGRTPLMPRLSLQEQNQRRSYDMLRTPQPLGLSNFDEMMAMHRDSKNEPELTKPTDLPWLEAPVFRRQELEDTLPVKKVAGGVVRSDVARLVRYALMYVEKTEILSMLRMLGADRLRDLEPSFFRDFLDRLNSRVGRTSGRWRADRPSFSGWYFANRLPHPTSGLPKHEVCPEASKAGRFVRCYNANSEQWSQAVTVVEQDVNAEKALQVSRPDYLERAMARAYDGRDPIVWRESRYDTRQILIMLGTTPDRSLSC